MRTAILWLCWGCVSERALGSMDEGEQARAIGALSPSRARRLVPVLEKWASAPREQDHQLSRAALEALIRADTEDSFLVTLKLSERHPRNVAKAWAAVPTRRSCRALDRLLRFWPEGELRLFDEEKARLALTSPPCSRWSRP